jgi:hypothetical protein
VRSTSTPFSFIKSWFTRLPDRGGGLLAHDDEVGPTVAVDVAHGVVLLVAVVRDLRRGRAVRVLDAVVVPHEGRPLVIELGAGCRRRESGGEQTQGDALAVDHENSSSFRHRRAGGRPPTMQTCGGN